MGRENGKGTEARAAASVWGPLRRRLAVPCGGCRTLSLGAAPGQSRSQVPCWAEGSLSQVFASPSSPSHLNLQNCKHTVPLGHKADPPA